MRNKVYVVNSIKDKIKNIIVYGNSIFEAIEELLYLNSHEELYDTDWNITSNNISVVEEGYIV